MTKYKVYECEDKTSAKGNAYKKLVLQEKDAQYPIKNVTMFASHPLFEDIAAGQEVELVIQEEDSGTPNPKAAGKNYINRTVANPNQAPKVSTKQDSEFPVTLAEIKNLLTLKVIPALGAIAARLPEPKSDYPEMDDTNNAQLS